MEIIRDLVRDVVGIIFPGSFLVFTALCFLISILFLFHPALLLSDLSVFISSSSSFYIFLVFSYVSGQFLRLKQLRDLEDKCAEAYRKTLGKAGISRHDYEKSMTLLREQDDSYLAGKSSREELSKAFNRHIDKFGLWETFPYPIYIKWKRLLTDTDNEFEFFEKYEKQGVANKQAFFGFCQTVVYEHSVSLKEELLRQEALIRLFAGMYYALTFGRIVMVIAISLHSIALVLISRVSFLPYLHDPSNARISWAIVSVSLVTLLIFEYLSRDILNRLRMMRVKEVRMTYDSFYLVSKEHELDY